jgi:hypothetical protein
MPISPEPKREHPSTYFVQDRSNEDEFTRLQIQDHIVIGSHRIGKRSRLKNLFFTIPHLSSSSLRKIPNLSQICPIPRLLCRNC